MSQFQYRHCTSRARLEHRLLNHNAPLVVVLHVVRPAVSAAQENGRPPIRGYTQRPDGKTERKRSRSVESNMPWTFWPPDGNDFGHFPILPGKSIAAVELL
jgi:hypothetical protein